MLNGFEQLEKMTIGSPDRREACRAHFQPDTEVDDLVDVCFSRFQLANPVFIRPGQLRNERSARGSSPHLDVSHRLKDSDRFSHTDSTDFELLRQFTLGRQAITGAERAAVNEQSQASSDILPQRRCTDHEFDGRQLVDLHVSYPLLGAWTDTYASS